MSTKWTWCLCTTDVLRPIRSLGVEATKCKGCGGAIWCNRDNVIHWSYYDSPEHWHVECKLTAVANGEPELTPVLAAFVGSSSGIGGLPIYSGNSIPMP